MSYECESWTIKKAECQRIDIFELWLEKTLESPLDCKEIKPVNPERESVLDIHWKDWCWSWNSDTLTTWCEELIHWKRSWCWERLKAGGEREDRGRDGWMATPTWWKWVWASSGNWWWTGKPGVLQSMESQSQTWLSDWNELNLTELNLMLGNIGKNTKGLNLLPYILDYFRNWDLSA